MNRIYFDNNAATEPYPVVQEALSWAVRECWANPSSGHREGQRAKALLAEARQRIARCFQVDGHQVLFFSTATEALYTLIHGILVRGATIVTSPLEHVAVWQPCKDLEQKGLSRVLFAPVDYGGAVRPEELARIVDSSVSGIVLMSVNNETGVMTDIEGCARVAQERKIPFVVDAVAHLGKAPLSLHEGVSALCCSSYKIHGPSGVGFCVLNKNISFKPLFHGGGQEFGRRGGSPNVPAIHACSIAVEEAFLHLEEHMRHVRNMRDRFEAALMAIIPGVAINGSMDRVCNTVNVAFDDIDGETLLIQLDRVGLSASHGAACSAGSMEPSRILRTMGYSPQRVASSLRFSLGTATSEDEVDRAARLIAQAVQQQRSAHLLA